MKNLYLKRTLKGSVFPLISFINRLIPKSDNRVLLHIPNKRQAFSLIPLMEYLKDNGFEKNIKYLMVI